jgi:hypothetical protein
MFTLTVWMPCAVVTGPKAASLKLVSGRAEPWSVPGLNAHIDIEQVWTVQHIRSHITRRVGRRRRESGRPERLAAGQ